MRAPVETNPMPTAPRQADRALRAALARLTGGISPLSLAAARNDWMAHLAFSPSKVWQVAAQAGVDSMRLLRWAAAGGLETRPFEPTARDTRFRHPLWNGWPFCLYEQGFLAAENWWHQATTGIDGVTRHHEDLVEFFARQSMDFASPSNLWWANPEVLDATLRRAGGNFQAGHANWVEDWYRSATAQPPAGTEQYRVGANLAVTAGKVVLRNDLMELIQYAPSTPSTYRDPILIVPAWIMKYYILDLSPNNSLIRYLVDHGHTVFAISWKNPGQSDRNLGIDDYRLRGPMAAMAAISAIVPGRRIHAVGYCLGGTLMSIAAAAMARDRDQRLGSLSLFAAQTDFTEPGELGLFVDESQLAFLEDLMWQQGFLSGEQMAASFQLLRSIDLIWSRIVHEYLVGERPALTDLMAWNADTTRMPYRMHSEYLRSMFLNNDLAAGRYRVDGRPVALSDLRLPMFCVGTVADHVAPWRSVYKLHLLTDAEITFALTSGGHNAGVVNPPLESRHDFRIATRPLDGPYRDPEAYLEEAEQRPGSWWPAWRAWLEARSGDFGTPPQTGAQGYEPVCDAPGEYVLVR